MSRYGMIAGNGRFPLLALETARGLGDEVIAIGIEEEASPEIEKFAARCYWISLGQLSRLIDILKSEQITEVIMAGQVKHASIFSSIKPDLRLFKLLGALKQKNTDGLIGAVAKVLADEGIRLADSTLLLKPLLAGKGVLTKRKPSKDEERDIAYGQRIANALAAARCRAERRDLRSGVRGGGSDGRDRRDAAARGGAGEREAAAAGEGFAAPWAFAVRRAGSGSGDDRGDAGDGHDGAGRGCRANAAAGSR